MGGHDLAFDETPSDWDWDPALVCNSCCCSIIVRSHCRPKKGLSIARYKNINKSSSLIMITPGHGCYHTHTQQHTRYFVCVYFLGCPVHLSNFTEIGEISEIPDPRFPNPDPWRYLSRSVLVVIWANIQHLKREIFVASYNNSIRAGVGDGVGAGVGAGVRVPLLRQWNYEWCDTFAIEMFSQSRASWHAPAISYLLYLHRLRLKIGSWQLDFPNTIPVPVPLPIPCSCCADVAAVPLHVAAVFVLFLLEMSDRVQ